MKYFGHGRELGVHGIRKLTNTRTGWIQINPGAEIGVLDPGKIFLGLLLRSGAYNAGALKGIPVATCSELPNPQSFRGTFHE